MKTETLTITNRSGSSVTVQFDEANTLEDAQQIGLRIPTVSKNPSKGETSKNLLIIALKDAYPTRDLFLQRVESVGWLGQNAPGTWAYHLSETLLWCRYAPPQPPTPTQAREQNGVAGAVCPRDKSLGRCPRVATLAFDVSKALLWCRCAPPQPPLFRGRKASIQERGSSGSVRSSRSPSRQSLWPELSPP